MRIVDIRETAIPLKSKLANSSFDFSEMTTSVVAVITDVVRDGNPVCGFAFNSTGRYACGAQMRARFIPRILAAPPETLFDDTGNNLDPANCLAVMVKRRGLSSAIRAATAFAKGFMISQSWLRFRCIITCSPLPPEVFTRDSRSCFAR